ncbi:PD-(D/E)XK nuclease family protein [Candidatus Parcubacteria bacterium]|nr:PD-(D/E)XK nuclease family protein [Candidatus Parcubacteria bacterium]
MLSEIINQYYRDKEKEKKEKERVQFYISEVGKCPRAIFFKFKKAPAQELEPEKLRIFDHGDFVHQVTLRPLVSLGLIKAIEIPIPPHEIISGRADAILSINGEPYVLDVKSISGRLNFKKLEKPYPEHFWQVQLYLHFFRIKKGILLYVNKDTQELKDFLFPYDPEVAQQLIEWFLKLKSKIEKNVTPPRLVDYPKNWQCESCQYRHICDLIGEKEINWAQAKMKLELA